MRLDFVPVVPRSTTNEFGRGSCQEKQRSSPVLELAKNDRLSSNGVFNHCCTVSLKLPIGRIAVMYFVCCSL